MNEVANMIILHNLNIKLYVQLRHCKLKQQFILMFSTGLLKGMEEKPKLIQSSDLLILRPHNHLTLLFHPLEGAYIA